MAISSPPGGAAAVPSLPMDTPAPSLPPRDPRGHKGTFGTAAVVGGCAHEPDPVTGLEGLRMLGGPCFAAIAALRAGCGLARLAVPRPLVDHALAVAPAATALAIPVDDAGRPVAHLAAAVIDDLAAHSDALVVGPGLGASDGARAIILRAILQESAPVILDADGLNNLAAITEAWRDFRAPAVLTPHPGEFARLAAPLGIDPAPNHAAAAQLAQKLGAIVVLKGAATIVTDGHEHWTHDAPNPALATAGSGDVLAGIIAGLVAQHAPRPSRPAAHRPIHASLFDLARAGVEAHARAAAAWASRRGATGGLLAADLLDEIPAAVQSLRAATP